MPVTDNNLTAEPVDNCRQTANVLVLGLGNILMTDEGVGVHVVQRLQKFALPENVEIIDGGTAGLDILLSRQKPYRLIIIDALKAGQKPGFLYKIRFKTGEKNKFSQIFDNNLSKLSLHQVGLIDALNAAERLNCQPEKIVIIGVEPDQISCGLELTESVKQKVPEIIKIVLEELDDALYSK